VINQSAARRFWPGLSPLGQRIVLGQQRHPPRSACSRW
jgi:hypothetical protein